MRRWIRITVALAAAVALHALLFALLPRGAQKKREAPLEVRLVSREPAVEREQVRVKVAVSDSGKGKGKGAESEHKLDRGSDHENEDEHEHEMTRWSAEWSEQEGVSPASHGLSFELTPPPASAEPATPPPPDEKTVVTRRIQGWANDTKARQRAEVPDEYWRGIRAALERGFLPDRGMLAGSSSPFENYRRAAEAYGKTGNPYGPDERSGSERNELRGLDSVSLGAIPQAAVSLGAIFSLVEGGHFLVARVRITQHQDGTVLAVELAATSGSAAFDKLALSQARSLDKLKLGAPPQGTMTLWAFETDFSGGPRSRVRLEAIY